MSRALTLLLALWALAGVHTTIHVLNGPVQFTGVYGIRREGVGATACVHGRPIIWLAPYATIPDLDHELAHAVDCLDDGVMNGSPGTRPAVRPAWASDFCWDSDIEWYACAVVHDGQVHPGGEPRPPAPADGTPPALP